MATSAFSTTPLRVPQAPATRENSARQSLRLSQLQAVPPVAVPPAVVYSPGTAAGYSTQADVGEDEPAVSDLVSSKDNLLIRCKESIEELHAEIDQQKKQKDALNKSLAETGGELEGMKRTIQEREERIEQLEKENKGLADDLAQSRELAQKAKEARRGIVGAEQEEMRQDNETLIGLVEDRDKQVKELTETVGGLEQRISEQEVVHKVVLEETNKQAATVCDSLDAQVKSLSAENAQLRADVETLERRRQAEAELQENERREAVERLRGYEKENAALREELANTVERMQRNIAASSDNVVTIERLQRQLEEGELEAKALAEAKLESESACGKMMEELRQNDEALQRLKHEYSAEMDRLGGTLRQTSLEAARTREEGEVRLENYRSAVEEANREKDQNMRDLVAAEAEIVRLKKLVVTEKERSGKTAEEMFATQRELKAEMEKRAGVEKQWREGLERISEELIHERELRKEADRVLEQTEVKLRGLDAKYSKDLEYYKAGCKEREQAIRDGQEKLERVLEKANYKRLEAATALDRLETQNNKLRGISAKSKSLDLNKIVAAISEEIERLAKCSDGMPIDTKCTAK